MPSTNNVVVAAMAGAVAGAIIGVLLAPASGRETRRNIAKSVTSAKDTLAYRLLQAEELVAQLRQKFAAKSAEEATT